MKIKEFGARNFRALKEFHLAVDTNELVFTGPNGSGKTSALEVIYYLCTVHSFRTFDTSQLINYEKDSSSVFGVIEKNGSLDTVSINLNKTSTQISFNNSPGDKFCLINKFPCTTYTQEDIKLVVGTPKQKRLALDRVLSIQSADFSHAYSQYFHYLRERNAALKQAKPDIAGLYNTYIARFGLYIKNARRAYINEINNQIKSYKGLHKQEIDYVSDWKECSSEAEILNSLESHFDSDIKKQKTSVGIQQDDVGFYSNGKNAEWYFSQGQIKYLTLCLKDSINTLFARQNKTQPFILVDDVLLDMDKGHKQTMIEYISRHEDTQSFWTFLDEEEKRNSDRTKVVTIVDGELIQAQ